jgi:hypothetical protein
LWSQKGHKGLGGKNAKFSFAKKYGVCCIALTNYAGIDKVPS